MDIDLPTLMIAGSFVSAVSGVFLIFAWLQTDKAYGVLWWAAADLILAVAIPMMAAPGAMPNSPPVIVGMTLLNLSPALIWASARAVNRRRIDLMLVASGAVLWLVAYAMPAFRESANAQVVFNLLLVATFLFLAAFEFWRGRSEHLAARWPLVVLLGLHALFSVASGIDKMFGGNVTSSIATLQSWLGFVHLETLAFVIGTSIFTVAMARERNEMAHKIAAATDSLTGVATRRAFYDEGEKMVAASLHNDTALAMILFDLDGFKEINDTHGHGPGDEVLRLFGASAMKTLRGTDLIGRLGGEEFAALLPGASIGAAYLAAERIRLAFTAACANIGENGIRATVSAGITQAHIDSTLDALVQSADLALYRAKVQGRDRVEVAESIDTKMPEPQVVPGLSRKVA